MYEAVERSDIEKARDLQKQMNQVIAQLEEVGVYQAIKHIFKQFDVDGGYMKFPFRELTEGQKKQAKMIADDLTSER